MNTLWNEGALPAFPRLAESLRADAAVVGGGMAGILTAFFLHESGLRVVLLEEDRLAGSVTARTTARISAQRGLFCARLIRDFGMHLARQYLAAQLHAVRQYRDLIAARGITCDFREQRSCVYAAPNGPDLLEELEAARALGAPVTLRAIDALPFPVREALCFEHQAQFAPLPFLAALLPGLTVFEHSPVRDIRGRTVYCDGGRVEAGQIVVATRWPMLERWGLYRLRLRQEQGCLLALEGAPPLDGWYLDAGTEGWSFQQYGDRLILGGGRRRCGTGGDSFAALRAQARLWFPQAHEVGAWSTQDCVTLDGVPYIGQYSPATPYLHVATGFGGCGMTGSMVAATLLTASLLGRHYPYADVFSPARFFPSASIEAMMEGALYAVRGKAQRLSTAAERAAAGIAPGHAGFVRHHGRVYGVYRREDGTLCAVSPVCPHRGARLQWNDEEKTWDCPCHGSRFDCTGRRLYHPAKTALQQMELGPWEV